MSSKYFSINSLWSVLTLCLALTACDKLPDRSKPPQIQDLNSVGCLIANDFYAVHFSAYLKPTQNIQEMKESEREALLQPYCQEIPKPGKLFFSADLIDRDVRQTPVGVKIVELEKTGSDPTKIESYKEVKTIAEVAAQAYPRGVVEAQADLTKNGDYAMILIIGGEEALAEDDKLKVLFHVGSNPLALSPQMLIYLGAGLIILLVVGGIGYVMVKKRKAKQLMNDAGA